MKKIIQYFPPSFYMTLILMFIFGVSAKHYFTLDNMEMILRQAAPLLVISCGETVVVLTQGTDLSLGSIVSLMSVFWILLMNLGLSVVAAIFCCLVLALLCGFINGWVASKLKIPVFITTLGTQNIFKSAALLLCASHTIYHSHPVFRTVAKKGFFHLSWSAWIALAAYGLTIFLIKKTRFGMRIRALGGNEEAIIAAGGSIERSRIMAFIYAGLMAGIGGLLVCCRIESGNPNAGNGLEFSAVAAALLGGCSLREGRGEPAGIIFGVLLIQVLKSGLMQVGVSSIYQNAIIGVVVLAAIIFDAVYRRIDAD